MNHKRELKMESEAQLTETLYMRVYIFSTSEDGSANYLVKVSTATRDRRAQDISLNHVT